MKRRSSEGHPSLLEDGRVATESERISNQDGGKCCSWSARLCRYRRDARIKLKKKIMKRSHILEERRKQVNPDIRKSVTEVFDRIDAASDAND